MAIFEAFQIIQQIRSVAISLRPLLLNRFVRDHYYVVRYAVSLHRDRDGVIEEIGPHSDLDGLGTKNIALQLKWTPTDTIEVNLRQNWMDIDRKFGGANGGGLVVLNEENGPNRINWLTPGYRRIDTAI